MKRSEGGIRAPAKRGWGNPPVGLNMNLPFFVYAEIHDGDRTFDVRSFETYEEAEDELITMRFRHPNARKYFIERARWTLTRREEHSMKGEVYREWTTRDYGTIRIIHN